MDVTCCLPPHQCRPPRDWAKLLEDALKAKDYYDTLLVNGLITKAKHMRMVKALRDGLAA